MILYFNCYIENGLAPTFAANSHSIMPVMYPRSEVNISDIDKLLILEGTIKSYSKIIFSDVIFNIELENKDHESRINDLIFMVFKGCNITVNFKRQNSIKGWLDEVQALCRLHGSETPCLLAMNHDHPFVSKNIEQFELSVQEALSVEDAIYVYSHTPEYVNLALNNKGEICDHGIRIISGNFTESISISRLSTLIKQFSQVIDGKGYMGRIDWPGNNYHKKKFNLYIPVREHFMHYDAYGHVSTLRYTVPLQIMKISSRDISYTQEWISIYQFYLRDSLNKYFPYIINQSKFRNNFQKSIELFLHMNIKFDCRLNEGEFNDLKHSFPLECSYDINKYLSSMIIDLCYMAERNLKNLIYKILGK